MDAWVLLLGMACAAVIAAVYMLLIGPPTGPAAFDRTVEAFSGDGDGDGDGATTYQQDGTQIVNVTIPPLGLAARPQDDESRADPEPQLASRDELAGCNEVMAVIKDRVEDPKYQGLCPDHRCPAVTLPAGSPADFTADRTEFVYDEDGENERRVRFMGDKISQQIGSIDRTFKYPVEDERCKFVRDKLGPDADRYIFFNDNRLLTHPYSGQPEVCYVPPHVGNVSYDSDGCSPDNNRLYHPDFDDVVDRDGIKMALNQRAEGEDTYRPMCEIRFKKTATRQRVGEYLQYLYNKEPEREYWQQSTSWLFNQHFEDTKTMAAYMEQLLLQQNEIYTLTSDLADSRAQNKLHLDTLRRYLIPREYMHDYLFQGGVPPDAVADDDLRQLEKNLAEAAYEQKLDVATGERATDDTEPGNLVGAGRHVSRLYLGEGETEEDSARRHIMEWADYSEGRKAPLSNVVTERADLSRVWDRERHAAQETGVAYDVKLDSDYAAKRAKAAELPEGPLGYEHTENCTFRDEAGEDSCNAEFLQGCAFDNISDKSGQAPAICDWALDKDGASFNCPDYGSLFAAGGAGMDAYFGRLTQERPGGAPEVEAELDDHLRSRRGFEVVERGGDNVCVHRERGEGDCDAEFRNQCAMVNVGTGTSPDWVYLLNGHEGYPETRLVKSKAREAAGGSAVEIVGDVTTSVKPSDSAYVEIVDASGGSLSHVTDSTAPQAQLRAGYLDKLRRYDDLASDLDAAADSDEEKNRRIANLRDRLSGFQADCSPSGAISCQKTNCTEGDEHQCVGGADRVTARLTQDAADKLASYDAIQSQAGRTASCDVPGSLSGKVYCDTSLIGNKYTSVPTLNSASWEINPAGTMASCGAGGAGGNTNVSGAGVYEVTGPSNELYNAGAKLSSGWYRVSGSRAQGLDSSNAPELYGDNVEFRSGKFHGTDACGAGERCAADDAVVCAPGQTCSSSGTAACPQYRIGSGESGKLTFQTAGGFQEPKPTGGYGLYKKDDDSQSGEVIGANAPAYTLSGDTFVRKVTAAAAESGPGVPDDHTCFPPGLAASNVTNNILPAGAVSPVSVGDDFLVLYAKGGAMSDGERLVSQATLEAGDRVRWGSASYDVYSQRTGSQRPGAPVQPGTPVWVSFWGAASARNGPYVVLTALKRPAVASQLSCGSGTTEVLGECLPDAIDGYSRVTSYGLNDYANIGGAFKSGVTTLAQCKAQCDADDAGCTHFTFYDRGDFNGSRCKLMKTDDAAVASKKADSSDDNKVMRTFKKLAANGGSSGSESGSSGSGGSGGGNGVRMDDLGVVGSATASSMPHYKVVADPSMSWKNCADLCDDEDRCTASTYAQLANGKHCWLYDTDQNSMWLVRNAGRSLYVKSPADVGKRLRADRLDCGNDDDIVAVVSENFLKLGGDRPQFEDSDVHAIRRADVGTTQFQRAKWLNNRTVDAFYVAPGFKLEFKREEGYSSGTRTVKHSEIPSGDNGFVTANGSHDFDTIGLDHFESERIRYCTWYRVWRE